MRINGISSTQLFSRIWFIGLMMVITTTLSAFKERDSLYKKRNKTTDIYQKALTTVDLIRSYGPNFDSIEIMGNKFYAEFEQEKNKYGQMLTYYTLCRSGVELAKYELAREYAIKTISIANSIQNDSIVARTWLSVGFSYYSQGDFQMGIGSYLKALPVCERHPTEVCYRRIMASAYNGLGLCFSVKPFPNNDKALDYYFKALKIDRETDNTRDLGLVLIRLGILYTSLKDYVKAESYLLDAVEFANRVNMPVLQKWSLESMATLYKNKSDYKKALKNYYKSLEISKTSNETPGIISSYINISETFFGLKDYHVALIYADSAHVLSSRNRIFEPIFKVNALRSDIFKVQRDFEKALEYHKKSVDLKDSLFSERSNNNIQEIETRYKTQKQEKELIEQSAELKIQKEKSEKQAAQRNVFVVGILLLLIVIVFIYWQYQQKKKANDIIQSQKILVELKNKDIIDSIKYAKKIQEAILPPINLMTQIFPESFVFYQPRDIVSGDFYWYTIKNGNKIIAAVDCTGHSVPGAFMSMIGNAFLNEIVNEKNVTKPSKILDMLNDRVIVSLKQSDNENKDGMDIAIVSVNETNQTLEFAGANNPCWYYREGILTELKGDSQPIGFHLGQLKSFNSQIIKTQKNDCVYIFTDGYADQFGGPKGKKFKYKQLNDLFLRVNKLKFSEQRKVVKTTFEDWKGELEQVDDVCVIGLKI